MRKRIVKYLTILSVLLSIAGCMDDDVLPTSPVDLFGSRGVFIVNEGNYLYGNASLSYYDIDTREVINAIYAKANGAPPGDVAYTMQIHSGKGYLVVNNSGCIHVVDANSMLHLGTIEGFPSPRHLLFLDNNTALVSDLYARGISIINTATLKVIGKIPTGSSSLPFYQHSTENMIRIGDKIFVNCWSFDNKVLVINTESLTVTDSIEVGIQPMAMVKDRNGNLWVMNDGGYQGNPFGWENPSLMLINTTSLQVERRFVFPHLNDLAGPIATNPAGDSLYFVQTHIYKMSIDDTALPESYFVSGTGKNFRAMATDPLTGELYVSDAIDFMSEGRVYRYSSAGAPVDSFEVGIIPGSFCFN